jgi:GntR family transcriptional regulator/MocR family aminotransferase
MGQKPTAPIWNSFALHADETGENGQHGDHRDRLSKQDQIAAYIRSAILDGRLKGGDRLPSTRRLAADLGVARQTVVASYDRLQADGFLEGRRGAGIFVPQMTIPAMTIPAMTIPALTSPKAGCTQALTRHGPRLSERGQMIADIVSRPSPHRTGLLAPSAIAPHDFPTEVWARLSSRIWRRGRQDFLGYADPAGLLALREAVAAHLRVTRGLVCEADDIVITAGSQQAIDLAARLLLDPGDTVWVEDPGYVAGRGALMAAGGRLVPVPVDRDGLDVAAGMVAAPAARLALVTPSHHFPLGVTMSLARRLALLNWAEQSGAWIVEDDYDGEFRYAGAPLRPLRALGIAGAAQRVVYIGTFSKMLAPGLRLGFLVAPRDTAEAFINARALCDRQPPGLEQAVLADFIGDGHLAVHLRRMRSVFSERRAALLEALHRHAGDVLQCDDHSEIGLHLAVRLVGEAAHANDAAIAETAFGAGLHTPCLSRYCIERDLRGLVLGFGATETAHIDRATRHLRAAIMHTLAASL